MSLLSFIELIGLDPLRFKGYLYRSHHHPFLYHLLLKWYSLFRMNLKGWLASPMKHGTELKKSYLMTYHHQLNQATTRFSLWDQGSSIILIPPTWSRYLLRSNPTRGFHKWRPTLCFGSSDYRSCFPKLLHFRWPQLADLRAAIAGCLDPPCFNCFRGSCQML